MPKIALLADTHGGIRNDNPHVLENFKRSAKFFFDEIDKRDIVDIVHLGDLYDRRKYINFETSHVVRQHFLVPASMNYRMHVILGNHDQYHKDSHEVNALRELVAGRYATISCYSTATEVNVSGLKCLFMPWISDSNRDQALTAIKNSNARVVMGHLELQGFEMYRNIIKEHGDDPDAYAKFEAVYTGHFHQRSNIKNIHYIGALAEYHWSDYGCLRGFTILDTDTLEQEFIENPHKMFAQITYDDTDDTDIITKIKNTDYSAYSNTYVKVVVSNRSNPFAFDTMIDALYDVKPIDISIVEDVQNFIDNDPDAVVDQAQDTPSILDSYIEGLTLPIENSKMQAYMREVYKEAISLEHVE